MAEPVLYVFSGLPGTGKSTLAQGLTSSLGCAYLRIDTIEQALRDLCGVAVEGEGYRLAYRVAADNLKNGVSVAADSCNPIRLTRDEWQQVAIEQSAKVVNIEIVCSDPNEHQKRIEQRSVDVPGLKLPTWQDVQAREYHLWDSDRIVIDTAGRTSAESTEQLLRELAGYAD